MTTLKNGSLRAQLNAPAKRLRLHHENRHDWRWLELPKEAEARGARHFTDYGKRK